MITLTSIQQMFDRMSSDGVDIAKDLLWGFFFTDNDKKRLELAKQELGEKGFNFVGIRQDENGLYWLEMNRVMVHDPKSLLYVCKEMDAYAKMRSIGAFDGYDAGEIDALKVN